MKTITKLLLILLYLSVSIYAQDISKMRVEGDAKFLSGELIDKSITDANGDVCAGLKIKSNLSGLSYDSNNGIVKINRKPGEDLLFLSPNERIISIFKMDYMPLKVDLNNYGINLTSGKVWELTVTDKIDDNLIPVNIVISPDDARLLIDNKNAEILRAHYLASGIHTIVIQRNGYKIVLDTINVSDNNSLFVYDLVKKANVAEINMEDSNIGMNSTIIEDPNIEIDSTIIIRLQNYIDFVKGTMVLVKGGTFPIGENNKSKNDMVIQSDTVKDFFIGRYEVTFEQYDFFCDLANESKSNDEDWGRKSKPLININWNDAVAYCEWLSEKTGKTFRLPTEAEWEYAARGGNQSQGYTYSGSDNIDEVAWYALNSKKQTHNVGSKKPNELGLYDMSGNVWEWCSNIDMSNKNTNNKSARVIRGGSWADRADYNRVNSRYKYDPEKSNAFIGFRIVMEVK